MYKKYKNIAIVYHIKTEMKQLISYENAANWHKSKNKNRHDWVGKVIYKVSCKWLKFDHVKWNMHKSGSIPENEMPKILWDFDIQADSSSRPHLVSIIEMERTCQLMDFAIPVSHRVKMKKSENTWILPESWKNYGTCK